MSNKYSVELKKQAINYYLSKQGNLSETARHFNLSVVIFRLWVKTYEYHGETMFDAQTIDVFSVERKLKIINEYQTCNSQQKLETFLGSF